ncbi:hypothetical protein FF1_017922 [Malus domestica]
MEEIIVHALTPKRCYSIVALHQKNYVPTTSDLRKTFFPTVPQVFIDSVVNHGVYYFGCSCTVDDLSGAETFIGGNLQDITSEGPEYITYRKNLVINLKVLIKKLLK